MKRMNPNWLLMMSSSKDKRGEYGGYDRHERDYERDRRQHDYDRYDRREERYPEYDRRRQSDYDEYDGYGKRDYYGEYDMRDRRDYDGRERESYGKRGKKHDKLTREDADEWTEKMKNADGSTGRHWNFEQTEQVRRQHGYDCEPAEFYAAINMMYSDYYEIAKDFNVNSVDYYAKMAHAFLDDKDAGEGKIAKYYECIVE